MNELLGLALGPVISCSGAASRPLASSVNVSIRGSSADRIQQPIVLDFCSKEGNEKVKNWYNKQPTTRFTSIEYRKDIDGRFRHEFIVAYLGNSTVCRFDRRAREDMRGHALKEEGTVAEDSAHVITSADIESRARLCGSEILLKIDLPKPQDLEFILTVCRGIQHHPKAKSYSLLYYNCYFFSWTLITTAARRASNWEVVKSNRLWEDVVDALFVQIGRGGRFSLLEMRQSSHSWGSDLIHLGLSTMGISSRLDSLLPPAGDYVFMSIEKELQDHTLDITPDTLEKLLLKTQLSPILNKEVSSALEKGGQGGANQYVLEVSKTLRKNKHSTPRGLDEAHLRNRGTHSERKASVSLAGTGSTSWSSAEKRAWRKAQGIATEFYDRIGLGIPFAISDTLWGNLSDPKFVQPSLNDGEKDEAHTSCSAKDLVKMNNSEPTSRSLQEYIRGRIVTHFEQVQKYGLGNAEKLIDQAEKSMIEIWASVVGMIKDTSQLSFL